MINMQLRNARFFKVKQLLNHTWFLFKECVYSKTHRPHSWTVWLIQRKRSANQQCYKPQCNKEQRVQDFIRSQTWFSSFVPLVCSWVSYLMFLSFSLRQLTYKIWIRSWGINEDKFIKCLANVMNSTWQLLLPVTLVIINWRTVICEATWRGNGESARRVSIQLGQGPLILNPRLKQNLKYMISGVCFKIS